MKQFLLILSLAAFAISCNGPGAGETGEEMEAGNDYTQITVAEFEQKAPDLVDKQVKIKGLVVHTCKHGGKRMFITAEGTEERVEIKAGENIDSFDAEMEGSDVMVTGILREEKVDQAYLDEWEKEILEESGDKMKIHEGEEKTAMEEEQKEADDHHSGDLETVNNLRKELEESGKDQLSFYSVECISYEMLENPPSAE